MPQRQPARLRALSERLFAIDLRTLALFRVGLALVLIGVLLGCAADLGTLYSDRGALPRAALFALLAPARLTLFAANGTAAFAAVLLVVQLLLALMLLAGWRARSAAVGSFLLLASLYTRNPLAVTGGDALLLSLLFWAMFLPLEARYSLIAHSPAPSQRHLSWASAAVLLQVTSVFWLAALAHGGLGHWQQVAAGLLQPPGDATVFGSWLSERPHLLRAAVAVGYGVALAAPVLAFSPWWTRWLRAAAALALAGLNVGLLLGLRAGPLPWIGLVGISALIGEGAWALADRRLGLGRGLRLYYRGERAGDPAVARVWLQFLLLPHAVAVPAEQDRRARVLLREDRRWVVIDAGDRAHLGFDAARALLRASPLTGWWLAPLLRIAVPERLAAWIDRLVAARRRLPIGIAHRLPPPHEPAPLPPAARRLALLALAVFVAWDLTLALPAAHRWLRPLLQPLALQPAPALLAPFAGGVGGWLVVPGQLADGREVDVLRPDQPLSYERAKHSQQWRALSLRWRAVQARLLRAEYRSARAPWADYLCRRWNLRHTGGQRLQWLRLVEVVETAAAAPLGTEQHLLWSQRCAVGEETASWN